MSKPTPSIWQRWFGQPKSLAGTITRIPTGHAPRVASLPVSSNLRTLPEPDGLGRLVAEMRKDYQVGFCERVYAANADAIEVNVTGDGAPDELVEHLQTLWDQTTSAMRDDIPYGRVAFEKVWGAECPYSVPRKLEPLPFDESRMRLADDGSFAGIEVKTKSGVWELIPKENAWWLALDATAKQPHGQSRFKPAPEEVWKERRGAKENRKTAQSKWALRGPIIHGPETYVDEQTGQVKDFFSAMLPAIDNWGRGALLYISNALLGGQESGGKYATEVTEPNLDQFDPNALNASMERLDVEMLRAFGFPEKTLVEGAGVGTYGAVAQQMLILFAVIEDVLSQRVESFRRYVIETTLDANGLPKDSVGIGFVSLTKRPDAFVYEVLKLLLANPTFIEGILSGGVDVRQMLEQAGLPVTEQLETVLQAAAQRLAAATPGAQPGSAPAGEFGGLGRRQWQNNRKAIMDVLNDVKAGSISDAMAAELLGSLGVPPERAAVFIDDVKDGSVDDPELQEPAALADWLKKKTEVTVLAQVVIPRQGFKVPQASQVLNAGLREYDRLYNELIDAMAKRASQATLSAIVRRMEDAEVAMRIAGRVLGMLSPWQPRVNTYADGAASDVAEPMTLADTYRFPWIESAVQFLEDQGVLSSGDFVKMATADLRAVKAESGIETPKRLRSISKKLAASLERGDDFRTFRQSIEGETALTRSQTETLYRTQTKRGYVAGFDAAMKSPVVAEEFPAVLFTATPDPRVRDEHWDLDGVVVMRSDTRAYRLLKLASEDYNCRCSLIPLSLGEAESRGIKSYDQLPADVRAKYG